MIPDRAVPSQKTLAIIAVILIVATPPVTLAATGSVPVSSGVPYETNSGLVVTTGTAITAGSDSGFVDDQTIELKNTTFNAPGSARVTVASYSGTVTQLDSLDVDSATLTVNAPSKQQVELSGGFSELDYRAMGLDDGTQDFTYSAGTSATLAVHGLPANQGVAAVDSGGTVEDTTTTNGSGVATFSLPSGTQTIFLEASGDAAPGVTNVTPSGGISSEPSTVTADISDADFPNDAVNVTASIDGTQIGQTTVSSNGTVSFSNPLALDGGNHTVTVNATDQFGQTTTVSETFSIPSQLRIFNESHPDQLIDDTNTSLRVRFYAGTTDTVIERTANNGTVNLTGLPVSQDFVVTVRANNSEFVYRRIYIESIFQTQNIYLLHRSEPHNEVLFRLDDPTGQFPPENTVLQIEKPIEKDYDNDSVNETRYQVIAGDTFGASGSFPAILQSETRYRLRVDAGDSSRILGAYSVYGNVTELLQIQRIEPSGDSDAGATVYGGLEESGGQRQLAIRYRDRTNTTSQVEYRVEYTNGTTFVANTTVTSDRFADIYPLPAGTPDEVGFVVEYTITRGGETTSGSFRAGAIGAIATRFPIDAQVLSIISWAFVLATMGLIVIISPRLAPAGGTGMAAALTIIGTVAIPAPILGVAGAVSVLALVGGRG